MMKPRLVLCSGMNIPESSPLRRDRWVVELDALDPKSNTHLRLQNVTDAFLRHLSPRLVDLLEMAAYVYTADCEASRELAWMNDKSTEPWSRDFHFVMPVRDLDFWSREDVNRNLVTALNFLSSDQFEFTFCELKKDRSLQEYLEVVNIDETPFHGLDRVIMFSGGLDSLAGTVESGQRGESLVLVSHRPAPQINKRQFELAKQLKNKYDVPILHIPVWVNKSGFGRESTQRTRSFLFSALGVTTAAVLKAGGVRFYENGVISLNWPVADEVSRSRASRTTHPQALKNLQSFYRLVTNNERFEVDNPFIFKTKTDIVRIIENNGASNLIEHSCSCAHTMFQPKTQWHCGRCGQCIDRRIAILAAGLDQYDSADEYVQDVFTGPRPLNQDRPYDHNIAVNYARFASDLNRINDEDVALNYNLELSRAARCFPNAGEAAQQFIEMHKRHAEAVCCILEKQVRQHSREIVDGTLDKTSLIAMIGRGEHHMPLSPQRFEIAEDPLKKENVFRKTGDYWTITYDGKQIQLKDSKGLHYIAFLLQNQNKPYLALHLVMYMNGQLPEPNETYSSMSIADLVDEGLNSLGFPEDDVDKARSSVAHAISVVLKKLSTDHSTLHEHLQASLLLGRQVSYRPSTPTSWQL